MRVLIAAEYSAAQSALTGEVLARGDVETCDCARNYGEALQKLSHKHYDVVLLEMNLAGTGGIELLDRLKMNQCRLPSVILVTAHDGCAPAAFQRDVIQHILNSFSGEHMMKALPPAQKHSGERAGKIVELRPRPQEDANRPEPRFAIKSQGRILFINPAEIFAVQADRKHVLLLNGKGAHRLRESISTVADSLAAYGFVRIHRSVLVNKAFVEEIQPWPTGEYVLRLKGGKEYTVTRTYKDNIKALAEFWVGSNRFCEDKERASSERCG